MKCLICLFGDEVRLRLNFIVFRPACSASRCDRAEWHVMFMLYFHRVACYVHALFLQSGMLCSCPVFTEWCCLCSVFTEWHVIIGVNRPAFGGTVPHFHQMSRGPAKSADVPHFSKMVLLFFPLPIRPYSTCLPRNATK